MKENFRNINLTIDRAPAKKIHQDMLKNLDYNAPEAIILMCAIFIASIGLNLGSTAVVIGAMLISPIMGPIQTLAYSFAIGDKELLKNAALHLIYMVMVALFVSALYFIMSPLNAPSDEILARTNPTFWDLLIAVFGGFAGIIGVTRTEKTNVVPGVAIATALMPPLCTVGFGLSQLNMDIATGAFYLFSINAFFIMLSSFVGFLLMGMRNNSNIPTKINRKTRFRIQLGLLLFVIPSIIAGYKLIVQEVVNSNVTNYVQSEIETDSRKVISTDIDYDNKEITLILVGTTLTNIELEEIEPKLPEYDLDGYEMNIVQSTVSGTITDTIKADELINDQGQGILNKPESEDSN